LLRFGKPGANAMSAWRYVGCAALLALLGGCASGPMDIPERPQSAPAGSDGDGTPEFRADLANVPDAVPRPEPRTAAGNKSPYTVLGKTYRVRPVPPGHRERGLGSWYGTKFHGRKTSLGDPYDVYTMTAAHKTLPLPSYVRVTNLENGKRAVVRVNDRGPFHEDRVIDLSYAAAYRLGYANKGTALLELEVLDPMAPEWVAKRAGREYRRPDALPDVVAGADAGVAVAAMDEGLQRRVWLQAGAFRSLDGARNLQRNLIALLDQDVIIQTVAGWHRVRVGPLASDAVLDDALRRLAAARLAAQVVTE
jgi:rare lipoprotein A